MIHRAADAPPVTLLGWLRAQVDADEQVARAASSGTWTWRTPLRVEAESSLRPGHQLTSCLFTGDGGNVTEADARHITAWQPTRVLAEIVAKKAVLAKWSDTAVCESHTSGYEEAIDDVLRLMAQPYRGRPGWQEEWMQA